MLRLSEKVAVITGGAGTIGRAAGELFLKEGARVLLVDLSEQILRREVESMESENVRYVVADVTKSPQVKHYIRKAVEFFGGIDIFISNAGIEGVVKRLTKYPTKIFDKVMAVNVRGTWLGLKYAIPEMKNRKGASIIITSSYAGIGGVTGVSAYVASKHALVGLMRAAALECASSGIRVNTVNPGPIDGRMMTSLEGSMIHDEESRAGDLIRKTIPVKRYGVPEEVARLMVFLASDESLFCTGGVYVVDGGISAR